MTASLPATIVDGMIKPDVPLGLPNQSRVRITVEPAVEGLEVQGSPRTPLEAWESLKKLLRDEPINSGGLHYTRDQLYERD